MNRAQLVPAASRRKMIFFVGVIVAVIVAVAGMWMVTGWKHGLRSPGYGTEVGKKVSVSRVKEVPSEDHRSLDHTSPASSARSSRQPLQFRAKPVEPAAVLGVLASGKQTVNERVQQLQAMRGIVVSKDERESALAFFAGKQVPEGMGKGSMQWLADELLTVLRLQEPPWDGLAAELAKVAFQPGTDPVVRDYIMQHLGHLWEQYGAREEIEKSLWRAVASSDETTPGTALIALSRGYQRDQQEKSLEKVRQQAFALARNPATGLAVRVTALSIAGEGGDAAVKELANSLTQDPATPVILKKVAEHVVQQVP
jgi:hypothetical protein